MIESVAENSEELMNKYFDEGTLSEDDLKAGLQMGIVNRSFVPVFALSATKGVGTNNFLDFVTDYFPSPNARDGEEAVFAGKDESVQVKPDSNERAPQERCFANCCR
jgi:elongation factor G